GGMSFAEAHRRRDEPEQISPGSLRPVGKLDASNLATVSPRQCFGAGKILFGNEVWREAA
ncbi:hypothetical protein, partial [Variovorax sp. DXTD-1]|uniref:hypothetical protein n=1 Tax=Variovorax sp. DXTD-1 TaxID=2495592 RepID=UPI001C8E6A2D